MKKFEKELEHLINKHCIENEWDMPDFIMAKLITNIIKTVGPQIKQLLDWHGVDSVCHPKDPTNTIDPTIGLQDKNLNSFTD